MVQCSALGVQGCHSVSEIARVPLAGGTHRAHFLRGGPEESALNTRSLRTGTGSIGDAVFGLVILVQYYL